MFSIHNRKKGDSINLLLNRIHLRRGFSLVAAMGNLGTEPRDLLSCQVRLKFCGVSDHCDHSRHSRSLPAFLNQARPHSWDPLCLISEDAVNTSMGACACVDARGVCADACVFCLYDT